MLSAEQIKKFEQDGFLHISSVINPQEVVNPVFDAYSRRLNDLCTDLLAHNAISQNYIGLPFLQRVAEVYRETGKTFEQFFNLSLPVENVYHDTPFFVDSSILKLIRHRNILDLVESVLGPEIMSNPIQHIRIKPPLRDLPEQLYHSGMVGCTPWHQDAAVIPPEAGTHLITVWVPLTVASKETGCLQFVRGGHRKGLLNHQRGKVDGLVVPDEEISQKNIEIVPAEPGDVILINRHCPHSSLSNRSDSVRFSLDLRYHPSHQTSGRERFPSFVARSRFNPGSELVDAKEWTQMWLNAREAIASSANNQAKSFSWLNQF